MSEQDPLLVGGKIPEMDIPGRGRWHVLRVYGPDEPLPCDDVTRRFIVNEDGTSYQVPLDAEELVAK